MAMTVAVTDSAPINNHAMVKQGGAIGLPHILQFVEKISELLNIEAIDLGQFGNLVSVVSVMGD